MPDLPDIQYLPHHEIDKKRWDNVISSASNGLIYAYSVYLDHMSDHWDALVLNDFEAVMPLTWKKKFGIYYLYQPPFAACLGVFGQRLTAEMIDHFVQSIRIEISLRQRVGLNSFRL